MTATATTATALTPAATTEAATTDTAATPTAETAATTSRSSQARGRRAAKTSRRTAAETAVSASSLAAALDGFARYAGLTAALTGALGAAGILATASYLSAWSVPTPLVTLDPLTAALRSELVLYQVALVWLLVFGLDRSTTYVQGRGRIGRAFVVGAIGVALVLLAAQAVATGLGQLIAVIGGIAIFVARRTGYLHGRAAAVVFGVVAIASSVQTGAEMGVMIRDREAFQTRVSLSVRTPVAGLAGTEAGGGFQYEGLYLVFRDGESIFVSRHGAGRSLWVIPEGNIVGIGIGG